jgi:NitT/TauT family transport system substrate-binding protein
VVEYQFAHPAKPLNRRNLLGAGAVASAALPLGLIGSRVLASPARPLLTDIPLCHSEGSYSLAAASVPAAPAVPAGLKKLRFTWNQTALCTSAVPVAVDAGIFGKHGLDVELVNFGGSTDQLLEAIGSGKADAGIGMILRWLKPLEQGFDVKLVAGVHGGCSYLVASREAGITDILSLRGKSIGVADFAAPDKNLYTIILQNHGLDPEKDVEWKQYPQELMAMAVDKGEIQAYVAGDPNVYYQVRNSNGKLFRVASNATNEFADRTCCVLGVRGSLLRDDPAAAKAVTRAILEASALVNKNPGHAVEVSGRYAPKSASQGDLTEMLKSYPYGEQPVGSEFRRQVLLYAKELKRANVLKPGTDLDKYVTRITADILS